MAGGQPLDGAVVRFRTSGEEVYEVPLRDVRGEDLAAAAPWRTFRWHKGQQHYSGWWWSSTMGGQVIYESRLELARLILADFDPTVRVIVAQPFQIEARTGSRVRRHVPDFLLIDHDDAAQVVNVKPHERLQRPEIAEALEWARGGASHATALHPAIDIATCPEPYQAAFQGQAAVERVRRFIAIVDHPTITRAAHTLGTTQSALTSQIARLEADIGQKLIERARPHRPCEITPTGRDFLHHARRILAALDEPSEAATG